jgi:glycosyltransferase involved in cell wall biosynthesis
LERLAISLGIRDRLVFTGYRSDIKDMMAAMDVVVIPSVLEGFPMITLEAMAMEKPIVATAIDGIMEQITDGKEGLLIAPKNPQALAQAVKRLVNDPGYTRSLGINARAKVVRDFSVHTMIAETIKVYETL